MNLEIGSEGWGSKLGIWVGNGDHDSGLRLEIRIGNQDKGLEIWIWIVDWNWSLGLRIWGCDCGNWDSRFGSGIGDWIGD